MKTWLALMVLLTPLSALAAPLSLKQVALQGGGHIRATGANGLLISDLAAVPFEYTLSTRTVPGTPIRDVTFTMRGGPLTDRQLAQVDRQLGTVAQQCLGSTPRDVQALSRWLGANHTGADAAGPATIGGLSVAYARQLNMETFEPFLTITLRRPQGTWPNTCTHEVNPGPGRA
ncbi:hypothetical protein F8S09_01725 [Deinococcus sp. SDU3-2]|uniref:Uncharacterized protein n=1 Tax=Deinococcus terrestris TaxID=2651870 RepID=A0A7X1TQN8_9DEIO|nr:hypothetical protein [Deinococcus terrestris]MPY65412.1 hypothetical protein [Deinococcus terrestris]